MHVVSAFASLLQWMPHILDAVADCYLQAGDKLSFINAALVSGFKGLKVTGSIQEALLQVTQDVFTPKIVKDYAKEVRVVLFWQYLHSVFKAACL